MKGNDKLLGALNGLLADELTAINQYVVHAEMAENWGYVKLKKLAGERSRAEMKHAERLIERILFLEGIPIVSNLNKITIGSDVSKQFANDLDAETTAIAQYNKAVALSREVGDNATQTILEEILRDEDRHADEIEEKIDQISQMGIQNFLSTQT
jgi:bacterioferritin